MDGWTAGRTDGRKGWQTDGRTDRRDGWMDWWRGGWMDGWMDGWMGGQTDGRSDGQTDRRTDGRTDGKMDGRTDRRTDGWMDRWMDEGKNERRKERRNDGMYIWLTEYRIRLFEHIHCQHLNKLQKYKNGRLFVICMYCTGSNFCMGDILNIVFLQSISVIWTQKHMQGSYLVIFVRDKISIRVKAVGQLVCWGPPVFGIKTLDSNSCHFGDLPKVNGQVLIRVIVDSTPSIVITAFRQLVQTRAVGGVRALHGRGGKRRVWYFLVFQT